MPHDDNLTRTNLRTPKAAAMAGIVFSITLFLTFWLFRVSIPSGPVISNAWLADHARTITVALSFVPFSGIAFLWFIGLFLDCLGQREVCLCLLFFLRIVLGVLV